VIPSRAKQGRFQPAELSQLPECSGRRGAPFEGAGEAFRPHLRRSDRTLLAPGRTVS